MDTLLNVHRLLSSTEAEGPGKRCCVWLQGCSHHCDGCFAQDTWSTLPRQLMKPIDIVSTAQAEPGVEGITLLGGEPFDQPEGLAALVSQAWAVGLSTLVFTGYTIEQLLAAENPSIQMALSHTDVLIDGSFVAALRSFKRPLAGSDNQRFLFLTDRYTMDDFKPNSFEIRISQDGTVCANGMGEVETVKLMMRHLMKTKTK